MYFITSAIFVSLPIAYCEPQRLVFEGAVVSARGPTRALSAIDSGLSSIVPRDRVAQRLGRGAVLVVPKRRASALALSEATPRPYSRKSDPCKRAKERKWMKKILGRYRCESNHAYFTDAVPDDTYFVNQYASNLMSLPAAWDKTTGSSSAIALVIDTGIAYTHPDLVNNIWSNPLEIAGDGIDNDGNGYIDDLHGINAILNDGDPLDDHGHGTHCAGILGAQGNNGQGIAGVAWNTKIAAAKFISSGGSGSLANAIKAINYGTALRTAGNNVVVSNNSWGGSTYSSTLAATIQAAGDAGILFVTSAGNSTAPQPFYISPEGQSVSVKDFILAYCTVHEAAIEKARLLIAEHGASRALRSLRATRALGEQAHCPPANIKLSCKAADEVMCERIMQAAANSRSPHHDRFGLNMAIMALDFAERRADLLTNYHSNHTSFQAHQQIIHPP